MAQIPTNFDGIKKPKNPILWYYHYILDKRVNNGVFGSFLVSYRQILPMAGFGPETHPRAHIHPCYVYLR